MSQNTFAAEIAPTNNQLFVKDVGWQSFNNNNELGLAAGSWIIGQRGVVALSNARGDYFSGTLNFYVHTSSLTYYLNGSSSNLQCFATQNGTLWNAIGNKSFTVGAFNITRTLDTSYRDGWQISASFSGQSNSVITDINNFACEFYLPSGLLAQNAANIPINVFQGHHNGTNSNITVSFASDATQAINNLQQALTSQNQTIINQNDNIMIQNGQIVNNGDKTNNLLEEQNDREQQGIDNIENQNSSDIQGSENGQTTSLINVISGFISAFSGVSVTNCNFTLEFPDYAGGSRVVNICSGKDKAPRIVEIGSSLLLICVFVPLAYILIRMIYNEIRSWTNG